MTTKVEEQTKPEIEKKLGMMSDFLKIEYLENCLKQQTLMDVRKFVHQELSKLYEKKAMYFEAAKNMERAAELAVTFKDKMQDYLKEAELFIKAARYDHADDAVSKALACGNASEKDGMKQAIKLLYMKQAEVYEKAMRNNNAAKIYEKLFSFSFLSETEKAMIKEKLYFLYQKLGKVSEMMSLR